MFSVEEAAKRREKGDKLLRTEKRTLMCFLLPSPADFLWEHKNGHKTENHARYFAYIGLHVEILINKQERRSERCWVRCIRGKRIPLHRFIVASSEYSLFVLKIFSNIGTSNHRVFKIVHIQRKLSEFLLSCKQERENIETKFSIQSGRFCSFRFFYSSRLTVGQQKVLKNLLLRQFLLYKLREKT